MKVYMHIYICIYPQSSVLCNASLSIILHGYLGNNRKINGKNGNFLIIFFNYVYRYTLIQDNVQFSFKFNKKRATDIGSVF